MELDAKDSQLQLLGKKLKNEHITDAITPESLNHSYVPRYFHYITVLTYDQLDSLREFFSAKLSYCPTNTDSTHIQNGKQRNHKKNTPAQSVFTDLDLDLDSHSFTECHDTDKLLGRLHV